MVLGTAAYQGGRRLDEEKGEEGKSGEREI